MKKPLNNVTVMTWGWGVRLRERPGKLFKKLKSTESFWWLLDVCRIISVLPDFPEPCRVRSLFPWKPQYVMRQLCFVLVVNPQGYPCCSHSYNNSHCAEAEWAGNCPQSPSLEGPKKDFTLFIDVFSAYGRKRGHTLNLISSREASMADHTNSETESNYRGWSKHKIPN